MKQKPLMPLRPGDGIALVNPAGPLPERFKNQRTYSLEHLRELGFATKNYMSTDGESAPQARADMLVDAFLDPEVKAILPIGGGSGVYEIIPMLDFDAIRHNPKIICGSSSLSALMVAISERANLVTFFGPHINFLNPRASKREGGYSVRSFWNMLQWDWHGRNQMERNERYHFFRAPRSQSDKIVAKNIYHIPENIKEVSKRDNFYIHSGNARNTEGEMLIATFPALIRLCRLGIVPDFTGKLIVADFLDVGLSEIRSMIAEVDTFSPLSKSEGLVLSSLSERTDRPATLPELRDPARIRLLTEELASSLGLSVYHGLPIGHCAYKLTLPIGIRVHIEASGGNLTFSEPPFTHP